MIGRSIENYKILEKLNRTEAIGVYKAVDLLLNRNVIIKVLEGEISHRPELTEGFRYEAATLAKLAHSCIPTLHSLTAADDELFMISEFAEGETLDRVLMREGKISIEKAVTIFTQVFDCVEYTHKAGIAHGRLKTSDVMLTDAGKVKILGYGTFEKNPSVELISEEERLEAVETTFPNRTSKNTSGKENDIYALAAMLYETLTGKSLFDAEKRFDPKIPEAIESVISKALSPNSAETFQSVADFRNALTTAGFTDLGDKIIPSIQEKSADAQKTAENSMNETVEEKSDEKDFSVFAVDFSQSENEVSKEEFNRNPVQTNDLNNEPPTVMAGKLGRKPYRIAGATIFIILVLQSIWQFSFIQSENLRLAEVSLKASIPVEPPIKIETGKPPVEITTVNKAKKSDVVDSEKTVQKITYRQTEIKPAPPEIRKKAVPESKAERLRRAEKLLTGM